MDRRAFLKLMTIGAAGLAGGCMSRFAVNDGTKKPNLLFIICDDLNDSVEGMGGHRQAITPNIKRLMRMGTHFTNAHANAPLCGPSRASLLSGLYPHTTGYFGYNQNRHCDWRFSSVLKDCTTMPQYFVQNGYKVMAAGKISHPGALDRDLWQNADGSIVYDIATDYGPWPYDGKSEKPLPYPNLPAPLNARQWDGFAPLSRAPMFKDNQGGWRNYTGRIEDPKLQKYVELLGRAVDFPENNTPFRYVDDNDRDKMVDERIADWAAEQFSRANEKPFFMSLGFCKPHSPLYAPQKYFDMFDPDTIELPPYVENDLDDCAKALAEKTSPDDWGRDVFDAVMQAGGKDMLRRWIHAYLACVAFVDEQIGKVLDGLEAGGLLDNTVIIFTSDNGYHIGEKNHIFKNTLWEEATCVPLVIAAPGFKGGQVCNHPVSLIDLYPTMTDFCDLAPKSGLDGFSLKPFLNNPDTDNWHGRDAALSVVAGNDELAFFEDGDPAKQHYSLRTKRWRYIRCADGSSELYDHSTDPNEWHNLSGTAKYEDIQQSLDSELKRIAGLGLN